MAIPENFKGYTFDVRPENIGKGRPKGLKNRSTILKEILAQKLECGNSKEFFVINALVEKAMKGELGHIKEIQDTLYGKIPEKTVTAETTVDDIEKDVTEEVLKHIPTETLEKILTSAEGKTSTDG